ncbi:hypothetical protein FRB94_010745 [Tulasnella sp. JGI-2019a]|nr:hypothetical protein FRB94_010745 [Tulasnella sp. JGI-2019a]KAG9012327.1 hypothetical protein FRB93_001749 [Tulasnella sp. JGI-2019a]
MSLEVLPAVARLSNLVVRVLGQNPGKFSLQGTNTYLIGSKPPWILVDTGEGRTEYADVLRDALREEAGLEPESPNSLRGLISDIVITHRHHDHHGGLPSVLHLLQNSEHQAAISNADHTPPRLHKFPLPKKHADPASGFVRLSTSESDTSLQTLHETLLGQPAHYQTPPDGQQQHPYFHDLEEGQTLQTIDGSATLKVIHTPGHTADSVSLYLVEERALFTADTVLGHGTAVFEDLAVYMSSLRRMKDVWQDMERTTDAPGRVYPGHGAVVEDGRVLIEKYIAHRQQREDEIFQLLCSSRFPGTEAEVRESEKSWTVEQIVRQLYASYPPSLWPAAGHGVILHLVKLKEEGKVRQVDGSIQDLAQQEWLVII